MPKTGCLFRGTDLTRAVRAVEKAGKKVARVEISQTGTIIVFPGGDDAASVSNPWDADLCRESD